MGYSNEQDLERHIREIIKVHITASYSNIYALENKKAVDIVICRDSPNPAAFFIEVKFHQTHHGRLGFGSGKGKGFQPELVNRQPAFFESNLRWVLASASHQPGRLLFLSSKKLAPYVSGGVVGDKYNNIQARVFRDEKGLDERMFIDELKKWVVSGRGDR